MVIKRWMPGYRETDFIYEVQVQVYIHLRHSQTTNIICIYIYDIRSATASSLVKPCPQLEKWNLRLPGTGVVVLLHMKGRKLNGSG